MGKLHELLAVEKTRVNAAAKLMQDTQYKFGKHDTYFVGQIKELKMLEDSASNQAMEAAAASNNQLPTTVQETLEYALDFWAKAEDVIYQKNVTNRNAIADIMFRGDVLAKDVPVDELMGLEVRLEQLRNVCVMMPTLPATVKVNVLPNGMKGAWIEETPVVTTKTEKVTVPVVLYEATDKHPAQVKESSTDKVVGTFKLTKMFGAATTQQKADVIAALDELIAETKQARMRANSVEASTGTIGAKITKVILDQFNK